MTIQEAIKDIKSIKPIVGGKSLEIAIGCMEEVEQYRALGTVEELKEAREKQVAKKPIEISPKRHPYFVCPKCMEQISTNQSYCDECGQALKWGEEDD